MKNWIKKIFWALPFDSEKKRYFLDSVRARGLFRTVFKSRASTSSDDGFAEYVFSRPRERSQYYEDSLVEGKCDNPKANIFAYYLTQFHPNDKNDEWWGKGVTEWNNVQRAVPQFVGHVQPKNPGELGAYDLRLRDNFSRQIELAKAAGIKGFAFYYYWFQGERLLEAPMDLFLEDKSLDIPFMICWANESWTRRFDGTSQEVLMGFKGDFESNKDFIDDVAATLLDSRYFRSNGEPVVQIYRPSNFDDISRLITHWQQRASAVGIGKVHFMAVAFGDDCHVDWKSRGFDSLSDFQPGSFMSYDPVDKINQSIDIANPNFVGLIYDYDEVASKSPVREGVYPAVMPCWDNTARRIDSGVIFHGATPENYAHWLKNACNFVLEDKELDQNLVFLNAWNEWGEGAYMEPDRHHGYGFLNATRRVMDSL